MRQVTFDDNRRAFAERGLPVLVIEGEMERELSGQTWAMGEAFSLADCAAALGAETATLLRAPARTPGGGARGTISHSPEQFLVQGPLDPSPTTTTSTSTSTRPSTTTTSNDGAPSWTESASSSRSSGVVSSARSPGSRHPRRRRRTGWSTTSRPCPSTSPAAA